MHDYFDILGVSPDAGAPAIRRASVRRLPAPHPDIRQDGLEPPGAARGWVERPDPAGADAAIDFLTLRPIVERMRKAFFAKRS